MSFEDLARRMGATGPAPTTVEELAPQVSRAGCLFTGWVLIALGLACGAGGLALETGALRVFLIPFGISLVIHGFLTLSEAPPRRSSGAVR